MIHMYLGNVEKVAIGESSNADDDANSSKAGRCNFFKFKKATKSTQRNSHKNRDQSQ